MMKKLTKIGSNLIMIGMIIYVIENCYFGWNALPMSEMEELADDIVKVFLYVGWFIYFFPIVQIYENAVTKLK